MFRGLNSFIGLMAAGALLAPSVSIAKTFQVGKDRIESFQAQSGYVIEYELSQAAGGGQFQKIDGGTVCFEPEANSASNCASSVGQSITAQPTGGAQQTLTFTYGINFSAPDASGNHVVAFNNSTTVTSGDSSQVLVPALALAGTTIAFGTFAETLFIVDADTRLRLKARLVRSGATPPAAK